MENQRESSLWTLLQWGEFCGKTFPELCLKAFPEVFLAMSLSRRHSWNSSVPTPTGANPGRKELHFPPGKGRESNWDGEGGCWSCCRSIPVGASQCCAPDPLGEPGMQQSIPIPSGLSQDWNNWNNSSFTPFPGKPLHSRLW